MSRRIQENIVLCAVLIIFIAAIVACMGYGARARVVPLPIATLGAILTVAQLVLQNLPSVGDLHLDALELFTSHAPGAASAKPAEKRESGAPDVTRWRRELIAVGLVLLLTGMFISIGPIPSIFLFSAGYMLAKRQYRWPLGIAFAALFTLVVYVLFSVVLGVQMDNGILGSMFGF
jgi:Tripartite tricarboxylate transporter TctB family